ncbi:FGGY family carbohydrate kinase [Pedobacter heparinus]|uniref:glycerol kinase n=1 Tax=Pedobacter heparinus (strain ATCC 13125 / DSM 2366 / CIP 104194 / JCM 7457 / NBRC 12017 / NCIMB 9290 / NRRL B-14731 / HIM 762-3) TaxID=485917 RepID=C6Y177_PEDHD|nr:glycerol kinase GlpK [Pedobacter heparinus]ACU05004.1 carbohydrate kinase FGGY [Pedobacter heparinus DSM 2366]
MGTKYILAIDQGTSSTKTLLFDEQGKVVAKGSAPLKSIFYGEGFVEQDPQEIYQNVLTSMQLCLHDFSTKGGNPDDIQTCGISNQRETFVIWDEQGTPLHNAIVWQCKRSVNICNQLTADGLAEMIKSKTGLIIDPYFSGTKLIWLYQHNEKIKTAIDAGKAYFGTIDTWLLYQLTGGTTYLTDYTNASRTLFFNLATLNWDQELLHTFGLAGLNLPSIQPSSSFFGTSNFNKLLPKGLSITAMIGDSHAAAFGEGCFTAGTAKATLGTGCSILMNIGPEFKSSGSGMISTICWSTEQQVNYALEGVIVSCGSTIEWLKNELGLFSNSAETESMAKAVSNNNDVYLVPAFSGLGAPYWDMSRKAEIKGLTFGANKNHIVRAALESIPYQVKDVVMAMQNDTGIRLDELMVNGGITSNGFVLQFMADLLDKNVSNMGMPDVSALGAAYLAGLKSGLFKNITQLKTLNSNKETLQPSTDKTSINQAYQGWKNAIT